MMSPAGSRGKADTGPSRPHFLPSDIAASIHVEVGSAGSSESVCSPLRQARWSAYRRYHSNKTAVVIIYSDIVRVIDRGEVVPLVLLDLSSAFDTVSHGCMVSILRDHFVSWLRGPAVEHRSLVGVLSLSCARPVADG